MCLEVEHNDYSELEEESDIFKFPFLLLSLSFDELMCFTLKSDV